MPFTPYHFGPPLAVIGLASLSYKHRSKSVTKEDMGMAFALLYSSVIPDLQGIYSVFIDSSVPLHGFSHTLLGAIVYTVITAIVVLLGGILSGFDRKYLLSINLLILAGICVFHLIPDMVIWSDMMIFAPFSEISFGMETRYRQVANILALSFAVGMTTLFLSSLINQSSMTNHSEDL